MKLRTARRAASSDADVERNVASTSCGTLAVMLMVLITVCMAVIAGVGIARLHADDAGWDDPAWAGGGRVATEDEDAIALMLEHRRAIFGY
jgi:hypothetical protein